ncbi:hypothetical protein ABFT23_17015 [Nocardioides sp. C4-1]
MPTEPDETGAAVIRRYLTRVLTLPERLPLPRRAPQPEAWWAVADDVERP